jgi:hypothetical protein
LFKSNPAIPFFPYSLVGHYIIFLGRVEARRPKIFKIFFLIFEKGGFFRMLGCGHGF